MIDMNFLLNSLDFKADWLGLRYVREQTKTRLARNGKLDPMTTRFDESLYHFWGNGLDRLTSTSYTFPNLDTYYQRNLGSTKVPGMIINDFTFVD